RAGFALLCSTPRRGSYRGRRWRADPRQGPRLGGCDCLSSPRSDRPISIMSAVEKGGGMMRFVRAVVIGVPVAATAALLLVAATAYANVAVTQVSSDPFTDAQAQHRTEVEPDTFTAGNTIVAAFQVGR